MDIEQLMDFINTHTDLGEYPENETLYEMAETIYHRLKGNPTEDELEDMISELHAEARDARCR